MAAAGCACNLPFMERHEGQCPPSLGHYIRQDVKQPEKLRRADETEPSKMHLLASGRLELKNQGLGMGCGSRIWARRALRTSGAVCLKTVRPQFLAGRAFIYLQIGSAQLTEGPFEKLDSCPPEMYSPKQCR